MRYLPYLLLCAMSFTPSYRAVSQDNLLPNADFHSGPDSPTNWLLEGHGRWIDRDRLEVSGNGSDSSFWWTDIDSIKPGELYRFECSVRRSGGSGSVISGPADVNRDQQNATANWNTIGHFFRAGDLAGPTRIRLGHWHADGAIEFDSARIVRALPIHRQLGPLRLGEGELVSGDTYHFAGTYSHVASNYHRVLERATTPFNSDRWMFGSEGEVVYRFALPDTKMLSATLEVDVNYYTRGVCLVEASRDGALWIPVAKLRELGSVSETIPAELFPAAQLLLRIRSESGPASFQVNRLDFQAKLDHSFAELAGETVYAEMNSQTDLIAIGDAAIERDTASGRQMLNLQIAKPESNVAESVTGRLRSDQPGTAPAETTAAFNAASFATLRFAIPTTVAGEQVLNLVVADRNGGSIDSRLVMRIPDFYREDYGALLSNTQGSASVWWCDATRKVPRGRAAPSKTDTAVRISAARHDYEAAQIVVRPTKDLTGLTATVSDLVDPSGNRIDKANVEICEVAYHYVHHPTDSVGVRDWWPDALPPIHGGINVEAGQNQPLWVLVYVPPKTRAGNYTATVKIAAEGFQQDVELKLRVWDFELPERNHLETAFGFSPGEVFRYHNLKTEADKRQVLAMYFESFAKHRISPYDPAPLDPIRVKFLPEANPPRAEVDFAAFDQAFADAVRRYHFTGYRLPIQGMGGGTFHERYEPKIGQFGEATPEYQAMFSSYVQQLEAHFRDKGWLDEAYVYWFDEPDPDDYAFVKGGMSRLHKHAPELRKMLTEQPGDDWETDLVDIWCPISNHYDHDHAEKRRAHGEKFWWYVCTGPKAPYCTLFIDHPATELRVWHWQAWQRGVVGSLVWQSNYWTSNSAFPDSAQDPYEDPMGYVTGYSTPRGVKRFWGNGDGRFLYPPKSAAVPGKSGGAPVIEPPVSSIRWEMLREGIEDYEYLYLLRSLATQKREQLSEAQQAAVAALLQVPESISLDMTNFTTDSSPIYARRQAVAEAIERLQRMEKE